MRIIPYLILILILISCKSKTEKQNETNLILSDSIFSDAKSNIFHANLNIKVDSIHNMYMNIKTPKDKLAFAKKTMIYSLKLKTKRDSINELTKQLNVIARAKEEEKWSKSNAGRIQKKHPDWSKEDCIAVSENKYWIGMTYDMLVYSRGKPNTVNPSNYGNGVEYQCCWDDYNPSCFYMNEDNIIYSYN